MPKAGESFTDPATGKTYKYTEGNQWREYVNGKKTNTLLPGNSFAGGASAGAAGTPARSQEHTQQLALAQQLVQNQVGTGPNSITQAQADAEIARLQGLSFNDLKSANEAAQTATGSPRAPSSPQSQPFGAATGLNPLASPAPYKTPTDIANTQDLLNQQNVSRQEAINRPGELNAFGGSNYVQNPDGTVTRVSTIGNLNPMDTAGWTGEQFSNQSYIDRALQGIAGEGGENNKGMAGLLPQLRGMFSEALNFNNAPAAPDANGYQADRSHVENSLYDRFAQVNEPLFERQQAQFREQMANRGIPPGSEKYKQQYEQLQRAQNDARQSARTNAIQLGGQEQQRLFEDTNTLRGNSINETMTLRQNPLNELKGLLGTVNPVNMPQFNQTANVNVPQTDFANIANSFLTRASNEELAKAGFANQLAVQGLAGEQALAQQAQGFQNQQTLNDQNFQHQQQLNQQNRPSFGQTLGGLGGGFLGGLFSGLGNSFGSSLFG